MSLEFSLFADDMILEILGHLPALDIIRYRRVCRRIFQASRERSVWVNVFLRAECFLPPVDLELTPTHELENLLVRMEIMSAKWTGARPTSPVILRVATTPHTCFVGAMPPYIVQAREDRNLSTTTWFHRSNLHLPVREHQFPPGWHVHWQIDPEYNILYMVGYPDREADEDCKMLKILIFQVLGNDSISRTHEHNIKYQSFPLIGHRMAPTIQCGYLIVGIQDGHPQTVMLVHLKTGKSVIWPVHYAQDTADHLNDNDEPWAPLMPLLTSSHLIQVKRTQYAVFKLPSEIQLDSSEPIILQKTHAGSIPRGFLKLYVLRRSSTCFSLVGLATHLRRLEQRGGDGTVHLHFLSLVLDECSSACQVREEFSYEVKGDFRSFFLAPCSTTSNSTLGLLTVTTPPPTHTPSGMRIARVSSVVHKYDLAVLVKFGRAGYEKPTIELTEIDLLPRDEPERVAINICGFDPYAGQIILDQQVRQQGGRIRALERIVVDYVSPQ